MVQLASLESADEELKRRISEAEDKAAQSLSENELLVETNIQLKYRITELTNLLNAKTAEKEAIAHTATSLEFEKEYEIIKRNLDLKILEDQLQVKQEEVAEASKKYSSLKKELDQISIQLASLESAYEELKRRISEAEDKAAQSLSENELLVETNIHLKYRITELTASLESVYEELKRRISEAEDKAAQSLSENELLVETNIQLKYWITELTDLLNAKTAEKEAIAQTVASIINTITDLTDQYLRASDLHLKSEAHISEAEEQLQKAIMKISRRDKFVVFLIDELNALERKKWKYKEQAEESSELAEIRGYELKQVLLKLSCLESKSKDLAEVKLKLTQELASYESNLNDLQTKLSAALASCRQFTSEGQKLQAQISSVAEEKNRLNEASQNAKEELQTLMVQLEEKVKEHLPNEVALKDEIEIIKAEIAENTRLRKSLEELEQQLTVAEAKVKDEKEAQYKEELEKDAALKTSLVETEAKSNSLSLLEAQVKELE